MNDPIGALVACLLAHQPAIDLVGEHVYGEELPDDIIAGMPRRAIVIASSGGPSLTGATKAEVDSQRIDLFGYGATPFEANEVRKVAAARLWSIERETFAGTFINWVNRAGGFSRARDRDGQWPQSFQSFQIFHAL